MWQLLELHSRICDELDSCKVPLCRQKMQQQTRDKGAFSGVGARGASKLNLRPRTNLDQMLLALLLIFKLYSSSPRRRHCCRHHCHRRCLVWT
ncbi:hypothetical protein L3X38_002637 [Prunus dulcis]|uniref:Uncharacterized protein n=1 Tax=Prunus dulcis TaxID=3755 RepID=A0AAD4ZLA7_PRUDU|nr:hypothetical protein L3X38_002637 [Prunus dulcis]